MGREVPVIWTSLLEVKSHRVTSRAPGCQESREEPGGHRGERTAPRVVMGEPSDQDGEGQAKRC